MIIEMRSACAADSGESNVTVQNTCSVEGGLERLYIGTGVVEGWRERKQHLFLFHNIMHNYVVGNLEYTME